MSNHYDQLWVHKYAPKTLEDIVLDPKNRDYFSKITDDVPNLLFYSGPGSGKCLEGSEVLEVYIDDELYAKAIEQELLE